MKKTSKTGWLRAFLAGITVLVIICVCLPSCGSIRTYGGIEHEYVYDFDGHGHDHGHHHGHHKKPKKHKHKKHKHHKHHHHDDTCGEE